MLALEKASSSSWDEQAMENWTKLLGLTAPCRWMKEGPNASLVLNPQRVQGWSHRYLKAQRPAQCPCCQADHQELRPQRPDVIHLQQASTMAGGSAEDLS